MSAPVPVRGEGATHFSGAAAIVLSVHVGVGDDGVPQFEIIDAPIGSHALYCQNRKCGDWYAEFTAGKQMAAAVGQNLPDAIKAAADKMQVRA